jgi:tetratricopeptide (TPR) repeat protein
MTAHHKQAKPRRGAARRAVAAVLIALGAIPGAAAQAPAPALTNSPAGIPGDAAEAQEYAACMDLARDDPKQAHETALAWRQRGGGDAATHCAAVALIGRGEYSRAAETMETLARTMTDSTVALRARLLGQAGNAWTIAGEPERAYAAQTEALGLNPRDPNVLIDRGITLTSTKKFWAALDDLNQALEIAPGRVDALVFRAIAWRHLESLELADDDIRRALALAPDNLDALLESGTIRRRKGDNDGARRAWLRVLKRAPDGSTADAVRSNLERMDGNKRR